MTEPAREEKKKWHKPQLIVLVRANPEESVLKTCKLPNISVSVPNATFLNCNTGMVCNNCSQQVQS